MNEIGLFGQKIPEKNSKPVTVYESLVFFQDTPKNEASFYLRFQVMPLEYLNSLKSYFNINDEWLVFQKLLKYFNIQRF